MTKGIGIETFIRKNLPEVNLVPNLVPINPIKWDGPGLTMYD